MAAEVRPAIVGSGANPAPRPRAVLPPDAVRVTMLYGEETLYVNSFLYRHGGPALAYLVSLQLAIEAEPRRITSLDRCRREMEMLSIPKLQVKLVESILATVQQLAALADRVGATGGNPPSHVDFRFRYALQRAYIAYVQTWALYSAR
jgi:hypothetical protein